MSSNKERSDFYKSFLNQKHFRDYRHIQTNGFVPTEKGENVFMNYKKLPSNSPCYIWNDCTQKVKSHSLAFLTKRTRENYRYDGNLAYSLSFFNDFISYRRANNNDRFTDRLMFDFDAEDVRLKNLKKELATVEKKNLTWKEKQKEKAVIQQEFKDLLFNTNILDTPLSDARKLSNYFHKLGFKTYPVFSGSKGVHLYLFINSIQSIQIKEAVKEYTISLKESLDLSSLDINVVRNIVKGVDRIPFSQHQSTGLYVTPFDFDDDKETILKNSKKQKINDFNFADHVVSDNGWVKNLVSFNKNILQKEEDKRKKAMRRRKALTTKFKGNNKGFVYVNLREFAKDYIGSPAYVFNDYDSYLCPFHNDNHASASVYENGLVCGVCGNMKPYEVISQVIGTSDYDKILEVAMKYEK